MEVLTPRPTGEGQKTLFVTFYSFKGGVGRSLALLNVACILAGLGRDVLMIDFDLEAPGLTHFQDKQIEEGFSRQQPGLVDAIDDFLDDPWRSPLGDAEPEGFFDTYVSSLDVPEGVQNPELEPGKLDLVPAGRLDEDYEGRMYDLNFEEMFEEGVGRPLFERLKDLIADSGRYDYILIDSRTGFSDEGSICMRFLADYLLVLTGLNHQNVRGTARFLDRSNVVEREETIALVASPVPMYYEDLRAERIEAAKKHISERAGLDEVRFVTQIPYHPVLALEEDPTVRSLEGTDLFGSYEEITERLRTWAGDLPEERIERVFDLVTSGEVEAALAVFQDVSNEDPEVAIQFLRRTAYPLVENHPDTAADLLDRGVDIAEKVDDLSSKRGLLLSLGAAYAEQGENKKAITSWEEALDVSRRLDNERGVATAFDALGSHYSRLGNLDQAVKHHQQALTRSREISDHFLEATFLNNLGYAHFERGDIDRAINLLEKSLELAREIGDPDTKLYALSNLCIAYALKGKTNDVYNISGKARNIDDSLVSKKAQNESNLKIIRAFSLIDQETALEWLHELWSAIQDSVRPFYRNQAHVLRARLRLEVENDAEGAVEDAQKALDFYRERNVDSRWSREAEEILEKAQAHEG